MFFTVEQASPHLVYKSLSVVSVQLSLDVFGMMSKQEYFSVNVYWMISSDSLCAS